jgi:predicted AAA+ superfamily ATPase
MPQGWIELVVAFDSRQLRDFVFQLLSQLFERPWIVLVNKLGLGLRLLTAFFGFHLILLDEMPPYFHYLDTQKVGNGTVADIATRAFANLLTAAGKKKNVCVVVSDLSAAYDTGAKLIHRALEDARSELGRQERNITPVDLAANEIYDILRKRLFKSLPDKAEIEDIAATFGRKLEEASKSKTASRGAEAIADEIEATYPFHPRLKNVIALFKENEQFKQTGGLIELVSRLLKSVWERPANDIFLIGSQNFAATTKLIQRENRWATARM